MKYKLISNNYKGGQAAMRKHNTFSLSIALLMIISLMQFGSAWGP